jgi:hypothetical protein
MSIPTKLPKPSDFVVILNHDFESLPLEPVPLQVYGTTASRLQLNRVELKSDLKTYFKDSIPDLSDAVYVGQTKGGSLPRSHGHVSVHLPSIGERYACAGTEPQF